jgi:hypothetical protein
MAIDARGQSKIHAEAWPTICSPDQQVVVRCLRRGPSGRPEGRGGISITFVVDRKTVGVLPTKGFLSGPYSHATFTPAEAGCPEEGMMLLVINDLKASSAPIEIPLFIGPRETRGRWQSELHALVDQRAGDPYEEPERKQSNAILEDAVTEFAGDLWEKGRVINRDDVTFVAPKEFSLQPLSERAFFAARANLSLIGDATFDAHRYEVSVAPDGPRIRVKAELPRIHQAPLRQIRNMITGLNLPILPAQSGLPNSIYQI